MKPGLMLMKKSSLISFVQDDRICTLDLVSRGLSPTMTVLNYLRSSSVHKGTKEGCAEGDCGACTVVIGELDEKNEIRYTAIDSCLVFLPMLHGKLLITVENLENITDQGSVPHPVQQSMVDCNGSQCGYCTPGIIMSLFALYKNENDPSRESITDALSGNLCRCTGYKPIIEAAGKSCIHKGKDHFSDSKDKIRELLLQIRNENSVIHIESGVQSYFRPEQLHDAIRMKTSQTDAILINGATDIALRVTKKRELLKEIIDLGAVSELKSVSKNETEIRIGAGMSLEEIRLKFTHELPALKKMLDVFGSRQIRSLATLGGNIGSASPIGDTLPVLFAYKAVVHLKNLQEERAIPVSEFITGYRKTQKTAQEIILAISIPVPDSSVIVDSYKVSKRKDLDISTVSAGFRLKLNKSKVEEIILAYGGMAEMTKRAVKAELFLTGKEWNQQNAEETAELIYNEFSPITDARSGAEFRRLAARNLFLKFRHEHP